MAVSGKERAGEDLGEFWSVLWTRLCFRKDLSKGENAAEWVAYSESIVIVHGMGISSKTES